MQCRHCNHVLWNAPAPAPGAERVCPECGTGYRIADYQFAAGKVEFHCPSCDQAYFGTSEAGHLEPSEFQCTSCGNDVSMERCVIRPVGGGESSAAMLQMPLPWVEPGGVFSRWWKMVVIGVRQPARVPAMIGQRELHGPALQFFVFNFVISSVVTVLTGLAMVLFTMGGGFGAVATPVNLPVAMQIAMQLLTFVTTPISMYFVVICGCLLSSLVTKQHGLGFRQLSTIVCFSSGGFALCLLPFCGGILGLIAWAVGSATAVSAALPKGHGTAAAILGLVGSLIGYAVVTVVSILVGLAFAF